MGQELTAPDRHNTLFRHYQRILLENKAAGGSVSEKREPVRNGWYKAILKNADKSLVAIVIFDSVGRVDRIMTPVHG